MTTPVNPYPQDDPSAVGAEYGDPRLAETLPAEEAYRAPAPGGAPADSAPMGFQEPARTHVPTEPVTPTLPVDQGVPAAPNTSGAGPGTDVGERLIPRDRADSYGGRWDAIKGDFVDEPRRAVHEADQLVSELLDELQSLFHRQRQSLEQGLDADEASTEDLRVALRRYRTFFDQLLAI